MKATHPHAIAPRELPKLTEAERCAVHEKLLELAQENQDIAACNQAALDSALMLDCLEDNDGGIALARRNE